uniref:Uncharacterized protein n=2 Tax=Lotharella globosa TaxID=91324 RepID=A0A6V3PSF9_9EUKA
MCATPAAALTEPSAYMYPHFARPPPLPHPRTAAAATAKATSPLPAGDANPPKVSPPSVAGSMPWTINASDQLFALAVEEERRQAAEAAAAGAAAGAVDACDEVRDTCAVARSSGPDRSVAEALEAIEQGLRRMDARLARLEDTVNKQERIEASSEKENHK